MAALIRANPKYALETFLQAKPRIGRRGGDPFAAGEHVLQCAVISWARLEEHRCPELALLHATLNGSRRHIGVASKLQAAGVCPDYPDLMLDAARHGFYGLRIELQTPAGHLRRGQAAWLDRLNSQGYMAVVCRGSNAAIETIKSYLEIT